MRDKYQCISCGRGKKKLQAHHIRPTSSGGKDTIKNLITLYQQCHKKVHKGKITIDADGVSGFKDQIAQRTMQGKAYLYQTASFRK